MNFNRDTSKSLNESIISIYAQETNFLTEEEFDGAYDQYLTFLEENFSQEELDELTEEELIEAFFSRLGGSLGRVGKGIADSARDLSKGYEEGKAGKRGWLGGLKPEPKEDPATEASDAKEEPSTPVENKKLTDKQKLALKNSPEAVKLRASRAANKSNGEPASLAMRLKDRGMLSPSFSLTDKGRQVKADQSKIGETISAKMGRKEPVMDRTTLNNAYLMFNQNKGLQSQLNTVFGGDPAKHTKYIRARQKGLDHWGAMATISFKKT